MRLSGHQASLILSSIWIQATSMQNSPECFEAMAHTYTLALSSILSKVSVTEIHIHVTIYHSYDVYVLNGVHCYLQNQYHVALLRFFQLAFSIRSISLNRQGIRLDCKLLDVTHYHTYNVVLFC